MMPIVVITGEADGDGDGNMRCDKYIDTVLKLYHA
jgi:hypothetical protein